MEKPLLPRVEEISEKRSPNLSTTEKPKSRLIKKPQIGDTPPLENLNSTVAPRSTDQPRPQLSPQESKDRGLENETRFYELMQSLVAILQSRFSKIVLHATVSRSSAYDLQDLSGEDIRIALEVRIQPSAPIKRGWVTYDVKSGYLGERKFKNQKKELKNAGYKGALFKKPIQVKKEWDDKVIVAKVIEQLQEVGLLPSDYQFKEKVLESF